MIVGLSHVTLSVRDLPRSISFYVDLLGFRLVAHWPQGAYFEAGSLWLAVIVDQQVRSAPLPEYSHIAFKVPAASYADFAARIKSAGATVFQENRSEGDSLYFLDPDGHKLEIHVGDLSTRLASMRAAPWPGLEISPAG